MKKPTIRLWKKKQQRKFVFIVTSTFTSLKLKQLFLKSIVPQGQDCQIASRVFRRSHNWKKDIHTRPDLSKCLLILVLAKYPLRFLSSRLL